MFGVSTSTVLRAVRAGSLHPEYVTPGGHPRFVLSEAERVLGGRPPVSGPTLTSTEVARRLGISRSTVTRAVKAGRVQPAVITPGGHYRYTPQSLPAIAVSVAPASELARHPDLLGSSP
jgi:excisionase family DNA binding protein